MMLLPDSWATGVEGVWATFVEVSATCSEMVRNCTCKYVTFLWITKINYIISNKQLELISMYITWTPIKTKIICCFYKVVILANVAVVRTAEFIAVENANTFRILSTIRLAFLLSSYWRSFSEGSTLHVRSFFDP